MDRSNSISNRLKHRIAQMLLSSSCSTTNIMNISDKISQEPDFPMSDLHVHRRGKLDHPPHLMAPVVQVSIDCSGRRSFHDTTSPNLPSTPEEEKRIQKKEKRAAESGVVYETGVGEGRKCPPASPSPPSNDYYYSHSKERKKAMAAKKDKFVREKQQKKKPLSDGYGFSGSSSIGSNDGFGFFSSEEGEEEEEEEEETWTLFSSKSFSSDSSEFYHRRPSSKKTTERKKSSRRPPRRGARCFEDSWDEGSKFQPLIPISSREKKKKAPKVAEARTGFAVVKQSSNPYEDFRSSMVEMMIERQMKEPEDLEQLLHSYLSLNSPCHHPVILEAFADIWEAIFREL
ncbi:uncharacterized protein LOC103721544 [Phoenix dactylifera]|uniref:Transcription repressor n=1 Tax=Phoenix dactylifera TaxID=42345 RepID=A0A8B7CZT9_PHODC|nr:uncharacterized protein LOC103721544 [Phoenix dactylifera]